MQRKNIIAIAMSALALIVSFFSVYWSHLRSADIEVTTGEWGDAGYWDTKKFWLLLPVTFTNHGARTATVRKIALVLQTPDGKNSYLLESLYFQRIEGGKWVNESVPIPVAVPPGESVNKLVQFASSEQNPNEFEILQTTGSYPATLLMWTTASEKPDLREPLIFELSSQELEILKKVRAGGSGVARLYQSQWSRWRSQLLGDEDSQELLE
jgi:hypothetical protein